MAPRNVSEPSVEEYVTDEQSPPVSTVKDAPRIIVWRNVILFSILHIASLYGIFVCPRLQWRTGLWTILLLWLSALGITAGAHRLWSHRCYKAKWPLRLFLVICNTMAFQNDIIEWARDHRAHHKYSETNSDPHNARRGFFFAHIGWLLVRKHPDVKANGKKIDLSDLYADPLLRFQKRFYVPLLILMCFVVPTVVPWYFWGESAWNAYFVCSLLRYCLDLHGTWFVNSIAHIWGMKPYDRHINPVDNLFVSIAAIGEGFHNYHHTFPQDYSTSEYGKTLNVTTLFLDIMAFIGLAYDRKKIPAEVVRKRQLRTGDGSKSFYVF